MPLLLSDGSRPDSYRLGDQILDAVYSGDERLWPLLTAQGMTKTGTQQIAANTFVQVTGWTANAGSTVTSNALVVSGSGPVTVTAAAAWTNSSTNRQCRVLRNGTVVWTSPLVASGTTASGSFSLTVAAGDVLTVEASTTSTLATNRVIAATSTFLRLTP